MSSNSHGFLTYNLCSSKDKVKVVNGSFTPIHGKGSVPVSHSLTLSSVIHAPNITCSVTFFPNHFVFRDLATEKRIGSGEEADGLYYLNSEVKFFIRNF